MTRAALDEPRQGRALVRGQRGDVRGDRHRREARGHLLQPRQIGTACGGAASTGSGLVYVVCDTTPAQTTTRRPDPNAANRFISDLQELRDAGQVARARGRDQGHVLDAHAAQAKVVQARAPPSRRGRRAAIEGRIEIDGGSWIWRPRPWPVPWKKPCMRPSFMPVAIARARRRAPGSRGGWPARPPRACTRRWPRRTPSWTSA